MFTAHSNKSDEGANSDRMGDVFLNNSHETFPSRSERIDSPFHPTSRYTLNTRVTSTDIQTFFHCRDQWYLSTEGMERADDAR